MSPRIAPQPQRLPPAPSQQCAGKSWASRLSFCIQVFKEKKKRKHRKIHASENPQSLQSMCLATCPRSPHSSAPGRTHLPRSELCVFTYLLSLFYLWSLGKDRCSIKACGKCAMSMNQLRQLKNPGVSNWGHLYFLLSFFYFSFFLLPLWSSKSRLYNLCTMKWTNLGFCLMVV